MNRSKLLTLTSLLRHTNGADHLGLFASETLEFYRGQLAESNAKLETLTEKLSDVESQKRENTQAIEEAERRIHMHKNNTRVEVFRLKGTIPLFTSS